MYSARTASVILPTTKYGIQIIGLSFILYSLYNQRTEVVR